jgi:hypothetical protein
MNIPENNGAENSANQVTLENNQQTAIAIDESQQASNDSQVEDYFNSDSSLRSKIGELTRIAEGGNQEEVAKAMDELSHIETVLEEMKSKGAKTLNDQTTANNQITPLANQDIDSDSNTNANEPKKFSVYWQGNKIEREDPNSLLGYKSTGEIKAALIKAQLQLQHNDSRTVELTNQLKELQAKLNSYTQPKPQTHNTQNTYRATPSQPIVSYAPLARPIPPQRPILSTNDPSLYTEDDIKKMDDYTKSSNDFYNRLVDYVANIELRSKPTIDPLKNELSDIKSRLSQYDEERRILQEERQRLIDEKNDNEHWKQFDDFQNKHKTFKTKLPVKELNEAMNKWMDSIAEANGVHRSDNNGDISNYFAQRANVVTKYMSNDSQVLQNAQGINPPEDYQTFFKLLDVYHQLNTYRDNTILGQNASLHDAYLRMKDDAGEITDSINAAILNERSNAAQQFATGVQQLQQHAVNIDPKQSAGGPDINSLGIPTADLNWFTTVTPDKLHDFKYRNPDLFNKWNAIADKIEKYSR